MSSNRTMDPLSPDSFNHQYAWINGIRYHYIDEGDKGAPILVLCHGFPDLWYGWRYQIPFLAKQYRVICPDMRGYGQTDAPYVEPGDTERLRAYGMKNVCKDMADLLDHVGGKGTSAIFIGHDWGGMIVWRMCLHYPERVRAVAAICTAYSPPTAQFFPLETVVKIWPQFKYQLWFNEPSTDAALDSDVPRVLRNIYQGAHESTELLTQCSVDLLPKDTPLSKKLALSQKEFDYICQEYRRRSFHGGLNYYRTRQINYDDERNLPSDINHQALMIVATADPALPVSMAKKMRKFVKNMTLKTVEAGHWVQMERGSELNAILAEWLKSVTVGNNAKL